MACTRGCIGIGICESSICCIQFQQDCGTDCVGIAVGFSRLQINAAGVLEICSNVGGVCSCVSPAVGSDSLVDNGDGTALHTDLDGNPITLDICQMITDGACPGVGNTSTIVDNNNGTFTHNDGDGNATVLDVCDMLQDGTCDDVLVDNGNGTFTHTSIQGVPVVIDVCQLIADSACTDTLVDNGDGTFTHTALDTTAVIIDVCELLEESNCTWQDAQSTILPLAAIVSPVVASPVWTNLDGPTCITLNNPTAEDMYSDFSFDATQIEVINTGVAPADYSARIQYSFNGVGGPFFNLAGHESQINLNAAGTVAQRGVATLAGFTENFIIPAGGSREVCIQRDYRSQTGFTGSGFFDDTQFTARGSVIPFA